MGSSVEHEAAAADQGPGDGDALLLAAGHLVGVAVGEVHQAHQVEGAPGLTAGLPGTGAVDSSGGATFSAAVRLGMRL